MECDPPVLTYAPVHKEVIQRGKGFVDPYQTNFEKDYVPLHPGVIENAKLGLF